MVTREEYDKAAKDKKDAEEIINKFHKEKQEAFAERMRTNPIFKEDELVFSAHAKCPCGAGLAYPKECGPMHYWDCSDVLTGKVKPELPHKQFPFAYYNINSENQPSAHGATTRPKKDVP